jgi:hypothetical protein
LRRRLRDALDASFKARASVVGFVPVIAAPEHHPLLLRSLAVPIRREERVDKTAVGWILRDLSTSDPGTVAAFVGENLPYFSAESLRNALKPSPEAMRREFLTRMKAAHREHAAAVAGRPDLMGGRKSLTVYPGMTGMLENAFISVKGAHHTITAEVELKDGKMVAEGHIPQTQPFAFSGDEGADVVVDGETNVSNDYKPGANPFAGKIIKVTVERKQASGFGLRRLDIDDEPGENTTCFRDDVLARGSVLGLRCRP